MKQTNENSEENRNPILDRIADLEAQVKVLADRNFALEQELHPFLILADNISDNIFFKDRECRFTWVNRNMHVLRGKSKRSDLIGKDSFDFHPPERAQRIHNDDMRILNTGEYILNKLELDSYADNSPMWLLTTKIPLKDKEGNVIGICGIAKDSTKLVQAEKILAKEGALRNDLLENLPDSVWFKDKESRFTWINKAVQTALHRSSRDEIIGRTDTDFFLPDHAKEAREDEVRIIETGIPLINKLEVDNYGDGTPRWIYTTKIPLHDVDGTIIGTCGIAKDVTLLKKAEDTLARETGLLTDLLDNAPDIVYFKDKESRFTWVNRTLENITGVNNKAEILGKTDFDFFDSEYAKAAREDELNILATGKSIVNKLEIDTHTPGITRYIYTSKMPLHDRKGEIIGTCGISRDMTALKKAEEALELESTLLNAMMDNIPDAIYFKDANSRFVRVSKAIHLEGLKNLEDAVGKTDFDFFQKEHAEQAFKDEQEILRTGIPIVDKVELEAFNNDRPNAWVSTTKVPIYSKEGVPTGLVGISRDVTERMVAQEAIRKAKEDLEIRVQERTSALVQEIKEHLRTERALREGEKLLQEANIRLESRIGQLNYLNTAAHKLAHYPNRKELLPAIVDTFVKSFIGIEAAICEMGNSGYECGASSAKLFDSEHRKICAAALSKYAQNLVNEIVIVKNRYEDPEMSHFEWNGMEAYPVYILLPLMLENKSLAVIQIFAKTNYIKWFEQEHVMLNTLAAQAAISLSNANNFLELDKKARLAGELEVAQAIQRRFTPQNKPMIPRVNLGGMYFPAFEVGGDYLDYFQTEKGHWVIVIADVSGKGIPAALVMTMLRSTFRAEARYENSAKKLLCAVNELISSDLDDKSFVTALCLIIDADGRSLSYARAGHTPLLLMPANSTGHPISLIPKGLALGMIQGPAYEEIMEEQILQLSVGDRILIFTDGLIDAMDGNRKFYGLPRLLDLFANSKEREPEKVLKEIFDDIRLFTRNEPYHDDLTMLAMEITG